MTWGVTGHRAWQTNSGNLATTVEFGEGRKKKAGRNEGKCRDRQGMGGGEKTALSYSGSTLEEAFVPIIPIPV